MPPLLRLAPSLLLLALFAPAARAADPAKAPPPAKPPGEAAAEEDEALGFQSPPKGISAQDKPLWFAGRDSRTAIRLVRVEASQLQRGMVAAKLVERLEKAAAGRSAEEAGPILELRDRLKAAWKENYTILARPSPVHPIRACAPAVLMFESAIIASGGRERSDVAQARQDLKKCVDLTDLAVNTLKDTNRKLSAVVDETVKRLAVLEAGGGKAAQAAEPVPAKGAESRRD